MTGFLWSDDADAFFGNEPEKKPLDLNPKRTPTPPAKPPAASKAKAPSKPAKEPSKPGSTSETPLSVGQLNAWIKRSIDESVSTFWLAIDVSDRRK